MTIRFSKELCEKNAAAEDVSNVRFEEGNAVKLPFPDGSFDAVTNNYVYHNITGKNKRKLLLETLRVLKKGGAFAIHDLMSKARYGDMLGKIFDLNRKTDNRLAGRIFKKTSDIREEEIKKFTDSFRCRKST